MSQEPSPSAPAAAASAPAVSSLGLAPLKPIRHLYFKAVLLMALTLVLSGAALGYLFYARGAFEEKQTLILTTDDSEGVTVGMDLTFSGFPIGSVRKIELADDGSVRILIDVPVRNAHRLRESSIFTMVRSILGATSLKAYTSDWEDAPLPDNAVRTVLYGDASAEIPQLMASTRNLINNLTGLTATDSHLAQSLERVSALGQDLARSVGDGGMLKVLLGQGEDLQALQRALVQVNTLLASVNRVVGRADAQVFGPKGLMRDAQSATRQLARLLEETRASLKQVDAILADAKTISGQVSESSADLASLRASVESNLRQIDALMGQLQSTWPFAKEHQLTLP
ncbi:MCE family protein [Comamonadaceae bacterium OH3737_COT-264]|nr:MCE family protein [Comamonadaceae bacterium OH3737_COT-264]